MTGALQFQSGLALVKVEYSRTQVELMNVTCLGMDIAIV